MPVDLHAAYMMVMAASADNFQPPNGKLQDGDMRLRLTSAALPPASARPATSSARQRARPPRLQRAPPRPPAARHVNARPHARVRW